ncbi:MAG: PilZ domain-containing protein [Desulfamplus sp.]|nr:PilZ domain-containing protein [Desulfamplus sp.]
MEFCKQKSYLINKTTTLSKQQLLILLENFPDIDITALLIKEILNIHNDNDKILNHLVNVVESIESCMTMDDPKTKFDEIDTNFVLIKEELSNDASSFISNDAPSFISNETPLFIYRETSPSIMDKAVPTVPSFNSQVPNAEQPVMDEKNIMDPSNSLYNDIKYEQTILDSQSFIAFDHRSAHRKPICMGVNLVSKNESLMEECLDISASGMFVKTEKKFIQNEDVIVALMISNNGTQEEITFESKVVRTPGDGIGIEFHSMNEDHRERLEAFLKNL